MPSSRFDPETVRGEAIRILRSLREGSERQTKLAEVKARFESGGSLEFETYFFFLRKFSYIELDREARLKLTEAGDRVARGEDAERFLSEIESFVSEKGTDSTDGGLTRPRSAEMTDLEALIGEELGARAAYPLSTPPAPTRPVQVPPQATSVQSSQNTVRVNVLELRRDRADNTHGAAATSGASSGKGSELESRYLRGDALGSGPLGTVFKAKQVAVGTEVCIKELKDLSGYFSFLQRSEVAKRLRREVGAQAEVHHPCVVRIFDQSVEGDRGERPWVVSELLAGSVRLRLNDRRGQGLDAQEVIRWFLQASHGLRAAHSAGLTHHNLKPENLLLDVRGNLKISDFGLTRVFEAEATQGMPQLFVGTGGMGYLAPELIGRQRDAGKVADVYGLGILLYEMLTGQLPGRRSPLPSEVSPQVPKGIDAIFDRMTQDRPEARYPDFEAVLSDFHGSVDDPAFGRSGELVLRA